MSLQDLLWKDNVIHFGTHAYILLRRLCQYLIECSPSSKLPPNHLSVPLLESRISLNHLSLKLCRECNPSIYWIRMIITFPEPSSLAHHQYVLKYMVIQSLIQSLNKVQIIQSSNENRACVDTPVSPTLPPLIRRLDSLHLEDVIHGTHVRSQVCSIEDLWVNGLMRYRPR